MKCYKKSFGGQSLSESEFETTDEAILNELKIIREYLTPDKKEVEEIEEEEKRFRRVRNFANEFIEFIRKYRVLGLTVAFIMAIYVGALVQALVDDLIMPIFQYIPGLNNLDQLNDWKVGYFLIGHFLSTTITFLIITLVVFLIVKAGTKLRLNAE